MVLTILKNMSQWEGWHPIYEMENIKNVWNHQPDYTIIPILLPCLEACPSRKGPSHPMTFLEWHRPNADATKNWVAEPCITGKTRPQKKHRFRWLAKWCASGCESYGLGPECRWRGTKPWLSQAEWPLAAPQKKEEEKHLLGRRKNLSPETKSSPHLGEE